MKDCVNTDKVTRLEIIDHSRCKHCAGSGRIQNGRDPTRFIECGACDGRTFPGRNLIMWDENKQIDLQLQDNNRTLKVFISERNENSSN